MCAPGTDGSHPSVPFPLDIQQMYTHNDKGNVQRAATATAAAAIESAVIVGAAAVTTLAASRMLSRSGRPRGSNNRTRNNN